MLMLWCVKSTRSSPGNVQPDKVWCGGFPVWLCTGNRMSDNCRRVWESFHGVLLIQPKMSGDYAVMMSCGHAILDYSSWAVQRHPLEQSWSSKHFQATVTKTVLWHLSSQHCQPQPFKSHGPGPPRPQDCFKISEILNNLSDFYWPSGFLALSSSQWPLLRTESGGSLVTTWLQELGL